MKSLSQTVSIVSLVVFFLSLSDAQTTEVEMNSGVLEALPVGPYAVETTNVEILDEYSNLSDAQMSEYLSGSRSLSAGEKFWDSLLKYPESAWVIPVEVPDDSNLYESLAARMHPLVVYVCYPTTNDNPRQSYAFPSSTATEVFQHMLPPGENPLFVEDTKRFPLVVLAHGLNAHSIYDIAHAQFLASHGYIVAAVSFGDGRAYTSSSNRGRAFVRPLGIQKVLDSILKNPVFSTRIDERHIGISGHSLGGYTVLSSLGARQDSEPEAVHDCRITAAVALSPWTGGYYRSGSYYPFGIEHEEMKRIRKPLLTIYGSADSVTRASYILPAVSEVQGPAFLVELIGQPHVYDAGGWQDAQQWELLFFDAYLRGIETSLDQMRSSRSFLGGADDIQHFDYRDSDR